MLLLSLEPLVLLLRLGKLIKNHFLVPTYYKTARKSDVMEDIKLAPGLKIHSYATGICWIDRHVLVHIYVHLRARELSNNNFTQQYEMSLDIRHGGVATLTTSFLPPPIRPLPSIAYFLYCYGGT